MGQEERTACPLCDERRPPAAYIKYKDCKEDVEDGIIIDYIDSRKSLLR